MDNNRRRFLRGQFAQASPQARVPRPPWALRDEASFTRTCTRCLACVQVCPTSILKAGDGGFPEVTFQANGCDECGRCVSACEPHALVRSSANEPGWAWRIHIHPHCLALNQVECRICGERCDHQAIRFRPSLGGIAKPQVEPDTCTGCGHCVPTCPTSAIEMKLPRTSP